MVMQADRDRVRELLRGGAVLVTCCPHGNTRLSTFPGQSTFRWEPSDVRPCESSTPPGPRSFTATTTSET